MEASSQQAACIERNDQHEEINMIKKPGNRKFESNNYQKNQWNEGSKNQRSKWQGSSNFNSKVKCFSCGQEGHIKGSSVCPAKGKICTYCNKPNHFEETCWIKSRENNEVNSWKNNEKHPQKLKSIQIDEYEEDDYIFKLGNKHHTDVVMNVEGQNMGFLVDSGSWVDVIDKDSFNKLKNEVKAKLYPSKSKIFAYASKSPLSVEGVFYANVNYKGTFQICRFHVMSDASSGCVIGRNTATALGLLTIPEKIHGITVRETDQEMWLKEFPALVNGLGKLKNVNLKLNIDENITPVSQHLRHIPFHVRKKIDNKIKQLIDLDIIEKIDDAAATTWVSPVVAIPKGEDIRMVVDMRKANQAIKRSHFPVPTLDELLDILGNGL